MPRPAFLRSSAARLLRRGPVLAIVLWACAMAAGFHRLVQYELRAGRDALSVQSWPRDTTLPFDPTRANLVMFAHPQCPCSRASMAELAVIMTRCPGELRAVVCFSDPDEKPAQWTRSRLWRTADEIPGVKVVADVNGGLARAFGSATSGQVFLFTPDGRAVFSGGITGARGHEGENRGRNLVIALARGEACTTDRTPVFGCSLRDAPSLAADDRR